MGVLGRLGGCGWILAGLLGCAPAGDPPRPARHDPSTFVVQLSDPPSTLDPTANYNAVSHAVLNKVFVGLLELDPTTLEPRPALAESFEILEEGRRFRFHLRAGLRFHDGRPVTADDFRRTFEHLLTLSPPPASVWILEPLAGADDFRRDPSRPLRGIEVEDERTLTLTLEEPLVPFLHHLAMTNTAVLDVATLAAGRLPAGAGPFRFESVDLDEGRLVLAAFDGYWAGRPEIDRLELRVVPDPNRALERFWQGELDMLTGVPLAYQGPMRNELGGELHRWPSVSLWYLVVRPGAEHEELLRQLLVRAIDRRSLCEDALITGCEPTVRLMPASIPADEPAFTAPGFDRQAAEAWLDAAGHPGGRDLPPFELLFRNGPASEEAARGIADQLAAVGVQVQVLGGLTVEEYLARLDAGEYDVVLMLWGADYPDPYNVLFPLLHSSMSGTLNRAGYRRPEMDQLLERGRREIDMARRLALYREAESLALRDLPMIPLYFETNVVVVRRGWEGWSLHPMGWEAIPLARIHWTG